MWTTLFAQALEGKDVVKMVTDVTSVGNAGQGLAVAVEDGKEGGGGDEDEKGGEGNRSDNDGESDGENLGGLFDLF